MRRYSQQILSFSINRNQKRRAAEMRRHSSPIWSMLTNRLEVGLLLFLAFMLHGCGAGSRGDSGSADSAAVLKGSDSKEPRSVGLAQVAEKAGPPKPPSPEQVAKWGILEYQPLQLLTCGDGFSDSNVQCLATSPNGKQFVLGGSKLTLWNTFESQPAVDLIVDYKGEVKRPIRSVAISPSGDFLAAGDHQGKLRIWNLIDQKELAAVQAHDAHLTQLAFSPDSQTLATTSYSGEVRLWKSADGSKVKSIKIGDREVVRMLFLSDNLLACASNEASIWNVESGTKETVLSTGKLIGPSLALSSDQTLLAFGDADSTTPIWNVAKSQSTGIALRGAAAHLIEFSHDGKLIATYSGDFNIRIWDASTGSVLQVIDADGGRTSALKWLPEYRALLIASEQGRIRIWGRTEIAESIGVKPIEFPEVRPISRNERKSFTPAQFERVIDIRSFPRLPHAKPMWGNNSTTAYHAPATQSDAESFYRYYLGKAGWLETAPKTFSLPGLNFRKEGCELNVSFTSIAVPGADHSNDLQVSLQFSGNYDARWIPKYAEKESKSAYAMFSSVGYRTKANLTDIEVALLKQFHEAGWTAYSRLDSSRSEDPLSRSISMLQGGSVLTVSIGRPADSLDEHFVQTSVNTSTKSLPIPPDAGWIEFDSSTEIKMAANTKMDLNQTVEFFNTEMSAAGWLAREAGRHIREAKGEGEKFEPARAWLPFLRGQRDVLIRLGTLPDGRTRIIVGDAEQSSWQLQPPKKSKAKSDKPGIEAADFVLPKGADAIKFEIDQTQIQFDLPGITPPLMAEQFAKQMEALEWKREDSGVTSDTYVLITFTKEKAEIQMRIRAEGKKSSCMISGDGLLWKKPLPTAPVRVSYETWLRRSSHDTTLDRLDEFAEEMRKIPVAGSKNK